MNRNRAVAVIIEKHRVLLIHRINQGQEYFVFPGGGIEPGETTEDAVRREVAEETSITIEVQKIIYHHTYDDGSQQFFFLCHRLTGDPRLGQGNELRSMQRGENQFYRPEWHPVDQLQKMLVYPLEIRDWLIDDVQDEFRRAPRSVHLTIASLRQTL